MNIEVEVWFCFDVFNEANYFCEKGSCINIGFETVLRGFWIICIFIDHQFHFRVDLNHENSNEYNIVVFDLETELSIHRPITTKVDT